MFEVLKLSRRYFVLYSSSPLYVTNSSVFFLCNLPPNFSLVSFFATSLLSLYTINYWPGEVKGQFYFIFVWFLMVLCINIYLSMLLSSPIFLFLFWIVIVGIWSSLLWMVSFRFLKETEDLFWCASLLVHLPKFLLCDRDG